VLVAQEQEKNFLRLLHFAVVALTLSGCAIKEPAVSHNPASARAAGITSTSYVQSVSSEDAFEIYAGQLALQRARDSAVRSLARALINDHTLLTTRLGDAAQPEGIVPASGTLLPQHSSLLAQLQAASSIDFETLYRDMVVTSQTEVLSLHRQYASSGETPALRIFAQSAAPIVRSLLNQAQVVTVGVQPDIAPDSRTVGERG
jgi:putative membrane protein